MEFLREEFLKRYEKDDTPAPEPTLDALNEVEDELAACLSVLDLLQLSDLDRTDMRSKRRLDMGELMYETADGLRRCPEIAQELNTDPAIFEHVVEQDMALGGLLLCLMSIVRRADNGLLHSAARAEQVLDQIDEEIDATLDRGDLPALRRVSLEAHFGHASRRRQQGQEGAGAARPRSGAAAPEPEGDAGPSDPEVTKEQVIALLRQVLSSPSTAPGKRK